MNKLFLMLWVPAVFMTYPPLHACKAAKYILGDTEDDAPKQSNPPLVRQAAVRSLVDEINEADPVVRPEDAETKRTDVKKIMGYTTVTKINGNAAICDMCGEPAVAFWIDCEAGCAWARCQKHR